MISITPYIKFESRLFGGILYRIWSTCKNHNFLLYNLFGLIFYMEKHFSELTFI